MDRKSSKELVERALATSEDLKNNKENEDNSANLGTPASTFYGASSKTRHSFSSPFGSYSRRRLSDLQSRPELSDWQEWTKTSSLFQSPSPPRTSRSRLLDTNFKSPPSRTHPEPPRKPFAARQKVPEIRPYSSRTLNGVPTTSSPKRPSLPDTTSKVKPLVPSYKDPHRIGFPNAGTTTKAGFKGFALIEAAFFSRTHLLRECGVAILARPSVFLQRRPQDGHQQGRR